MRRARVRRRFGRLGGGEGGAASESVRKERVARDSWVHLSCTQFRSSLQSGREGCRAAAASIWGSGLTFTLKRKEKEENCEQTGTKRWTVGSDRSCGQFNVYLSMVLKNT